MRKFLYYLMILLLALTFCVSAYRVLSYYWEGQQQAEAYDQLAQLVQQAQQEAMTRPEQTVEETVPGETLGREMLPGYAQLYARNSHTVGWLRIPGTRIDYPVMQSPEQPDYYLKRDFSRESSARGCLYVREECNVFAPSDNVTIYGHTMADGSMFADLHSYVNLSHWEQYDAVYFDTLYAYGTYQVFAVFRTSGTLGEGFSYHLMDDAGDQAEFDAFIAKCKELALYDTGITPEYGDKILCLSTCEYTQENGRLVVAAVRRESESS